jgi:hypothetical protein
MHKPNPEEFAKAVCDRLALTGTVGNKLAALVVMQRSEFLRLYPRRNVNRAWNGKAGKGDRFNRPEAVDRARLIQNEGFTHYVLLGQEVARSFDLAWGEPLEVRVDREAGRSYFLLPHPSGINQWWNEPFNIFRATKRLREFLNLTTE